MNGSPSKPTRRPDSAGGGRRGLPIALAIVATLGLVAVVYSAFSSSGQPSGSPATSGRPNAPTSLSAPGLDGESVAVPKLGTPTLAYFFALGCPSCTATFGAIREVQQALPADTAYLAIDINPADSADSIRGFLNSIGDPDVTVLRDVDQGLLREYEITALGTTVVFDSSGNEVFREIDPSAAELRAVLEHAGS